MKKIVCELCECMEFTKDGGMFICNGCGTKYTAEEARGLMREVEGAAPAVVPAGNSGQQLDNILVLAEAAYEANNNAEAENYCNQAIVLDAACYKAWMLKGKAVGWQSKVDDQRVEEAAHSFCKAIDFAPEEEKEDLRIQAVDELKRLGLALIALRKNRFSASPDETELNGFMSDRKVLIDSLLVLLSHGNIVGVPDGYLEQIALMMNEAAVAALNFTRKAWNNVEHPSDKDLATYLDWIQNIEKLIRQSIDASDEDGEADIVRWKNLAIVLEEPIGKQSYKRDYDSVIGSYWAVSRKLTDGNISTRRKEAKEARAKAVELEKRLKAEKERAAEEAKQARINVYWEAHADEKVKLESEKNELTEKKGKLSAEIAELTKAINAAQPTGNVPAEDETNKVKDQIRELENRRAGLGIFAGKEKKRIGEEITVLWDKVDSLKSKIEEEKKARVAEADERVAHLKAKKDELDKQLYDDLKRIYAIEAELTMDREV